MIGSNEDLAGLTADEKRRLLAAALRRQTAEADPILPLSFGQRALWLLCRLAPHSSAYNVGFLARIVSPLDHAALERAFQVLTDRHASLRCSFPLRNGEPVQRVHGAMRVPFDVVDAGGWPDERAYEELAQEIRRPFDLENGPVLRVRLYRRTTTDAFLALTFHHIVMDGWSFWTCLSELRDLYRAAADGSTHGLPPRGSDPAEYLRWQAEMVSGPEGARHRAHWRHVLAGDLPVVNLPADRVRPAVPTGRGASHRVRLGTDVTGRLTSLAQASRGTLQMSALALLQVLLYRYTGQDDQIVGYLSHGRSRQEFESLVGYVCNALPIRARLSAHSTFGEVLKGTRETLLDALDHQDYPLPLIVDEVCPPRDGGRPPLFQVLFVFEKPQLLAEANASPFISGTPGMKMQLGELLLESVPVPPQQECHFDLTFLAVDADGELALSIEYNTDLFEPATIARMAEHFVTLARSATANPDGPISVLDMLTAEEQALIARLNANAAAFPDVCLHQLFERHAARTPDLAAVVFDGREISYASLNRRANRFARRLRGLGVGRDTAVGVCLERSPDLAVAVLGILKAGGAFLPLDPAYPRDRLAFMIADSRVPVLVTQASLGDRLPAYDGHVVRIDEEATANGAPDDGQDPTGAALDDLAYMIYTSGSTGQPKGVLIEHRGLVNVAMEQQRLFGVGPGAHVLQFASLSFDAAVFELSMALGSGAALYLARPESLLPGAPLLRTLRDGSINVVTLPPSALINLPVEDLPALTTVTVAGEACPAELVARWAGGRSFFNLYGPTEATIWTTASRCTDGSVPPTIGRPIANTHVYVLDPQLQPVPIGVPGELHIGGVGLARGYWNRPDLTASRFIRNPFSADPNARLYKTGDLVRLRESGDLEYLGRIDCQVKIRGYRVELGEIETVLGQHPDVTQAVVVVRDEAPGPRMVAYVVLDSPSRTAADLKDFLKERLPDYMVPAAFVFVDAFPVTPAGKVDRRRLSLLRETRPIEVPYVPPDGDLEARIAAIWKDVLQIDQVGADDNFFDIGGSSLLIARVHAKVNEIAPEGVSILDLFQCSTIRTVAARIARNASNRPEASDARRHGELVAGRARLRDLARRRSSSVAPDL